MMKIVKLSTEHLTENCVTDNPKPRFSFTVTSEKQGAALASATISVGDWSVDTTEQILVPYGGAPLKPFTSYTVTVTATDSFGETDTASMTFETGRLSEPWKAKWITDGSYKFTEKGVSPKPMVFRKKITADKKIARAVIYGTAMGVYGLDINGVRVGTDYFAPGFTSYKTNLQYQTYDVTSLLTGNDTLTANVVGGWAVGSYVFNRVNRVSADRQALLLELRITYEDGSEEVIGTDESWEVSLDGNLKAVDLYDGETFDATVDLDKISWRKASVEKLRAVPAEITAAYGSPVTAHEVMKPVSVKKVGGEIIYDFGQNFAGVICAKLNGKLGQKVVFRHAEILNADDTLNVKLLRSAKATATYICKEGEQVYSPRYTYMGFRYVGVTGVEEGDLELSALVLYSDVEQIGSFQCSNELINRLQQNIVWSSKSNFVDIPTDCPQRDERMGWTGDISVFAKTAVYNFELSRFLEKWLKDLRAEQLKTGGIPNTIPVQGYGMPVTFPRIATDNWGDACVTVPWALYEATGNKEILEISYESIKKYNKACGFWAKLLSVGKHRYIWNMPLPFKFGDWLAPDVPTMGGWQKRSKWTATASYAFTSSMISRIAGILGKKDDEEKYSKLYKKISDAYCSVFTDGNGKLKNEFQTAYVMPLHFKMFPDEKTQRAAAKNLAALIEKNGHRIATGFPGTPFILFALADNGQEEAAFKMLENTECPSWLYEVKAGGTTIWERWDGLKPDGTLNAGDGDGTGGMISFNHYASGAVGDFLYKRVAGIEPKECGYKSFRIKPLVGGSITSAKGTVVTPYGEIVSDWKVEDGKFTVNVAVPVGTTCEVVLPSGEVNTVESGKHTFSCAM
ncbi:MAG: family 78 glycoside hydrolase catalytic domain [Clostridiales bacterium]|nr:family 78 glycoside hydrolase catalytic domain [Clostridiales bacterium]